MDLRLDAVLGEGYTSNSQISRLVTEEWAAKNLYCVSCNSDAIVDLPRNTRAIDFACDNCSAVYQLKSSSRWSESRVPDAAYSAMIQAVRSDRVPNLLVLQYTSSWYVNNLMLIPSFFFTEASVEERQPLAATARRAGWVGCNILLSQIAPEGKLRIVDNGQIVAPRSVREWYSRIRPLAEVTSAGRGWMLDVLNAIHALNKDVFTIDDAYTLEGRLSALYPLNNNVRPKIRQQLQVLRDLGLIQFLGRGTYRLLSGAG